MEEISLEEQVQRLERRVSYLERELGTNYDEHKFETRVKSTAPDDADIDFRDGHFPNGSFGEFARITNINGDDAQYILGRLEETEYGTALTETAEGLGVEVFTEDRIA